MTKSKFFRVAVEGATVDGRTIDRKWLEEMAATYNSVTYAARVNLEHIRGVMPMTADSGSAFGSYGDILAVKTDMVDLALGGQTVKKLALLAQVKPLPPLLALTNSGQKLYTSIEINPAFADTGKAYLMGLAVTDTPASLGTEMLEFSASQGDKSPLASRKQQPGNFFSVATETVIEFEDDASNADPTGVFASIKAMFDRFTPQTPAAVVEPATSPAKDAPATPSTADFAVFGAAMGQMAGAIDKLATQTGQSFTQIRSEMTALKGQINDTPSSSHMSRPLSTGAREQEVQTDC